MDKKTIAIIALSITSVIFMIATTFFAVSLSFVQDDFEDQMEVTRLVVEGFDAVTRFDFEESENYLEEAQLLQQEILDRYGLDSFY